MEGKKKDKQIAISPALFTEFERMADSYGLTNKALLEVMLNYFRATKADPRDPKADNPTDAIKALDKRLIGFIREQEKKILRPLSDDMQVLLTLLQEDLPKRLGQSNMRTVAMALKPEMQNPRFMAAVERMVSQAEAEAQAKAQAQPNATRPGQPNK